MSRPLQQITKRDIGKALDNTAWDLGNKVLYALCRNHPRHSRLDAVIAKVWLIGRSYSAAIERRRSPTAYGDSFYVDHVAPLLIASDIDHWIDSLPTSASLDGKARSGASAVHQKLTTLFHTISGHWKRSLAAKYLHFHRPYLFFIYDSRAPRRFVQRHRAPVTHRQ